MQCEATLRCFNIFQFSHFYIFSERRWSKEVFVSDKSGRGSFAANSSLIAPTSHVLNLLFSWLMIMIMMMTICSHDELQHISQLKTGTLSHHHDHFSNILVALNFWSIAMFRIFRGNATIALCGPIARFRGMEWKLSKAKGQYFRCKRKLKQWIIQDFPPHGKYP